MSISTSQCMIDNVYLGYKDPKSGSRLYNSDECSELGGTWISDNRTCKIYTPSTSTSLSSVCKNAPINTDICSMSNIISVNTLDSNNKNIKLYTQSSCESLNGNWKKTNTAGWNLPNNTMLLDVGTCSGSPSVSTNFSQECVYHPSSYIIPQGTNNLLKATYNIPNVNNNCPNNYQWKVDETTNKLVCANVDKNGKLTDQTLPVANNYSTDFKISNITVSNNCPDRYTITTSGNNVQCKKGLNTINTTDNLKVSDICPPNYIIQSNGNTLVCSKEDNKLPTANYSSNWEIVNPMIPELSTPSILNSPGILYASSISNIINTPSNS